ncbi:protein phosphatase Slingshot homolog 1 isoform X1 [Syngnathus scovelli]|uniref:protein phosphatase Slingshot homolog 1 isoform X1 n=2 Tax=Syngnathus scovelli TaxID=161590 RepID=UPI0021100C40|nr:protein phosphatase Slingshot homolog 1 isoform X1 [Syngnathus scovelli]
MFIQSASHTQTLREGRELQKEWNLKQHRAEWMSRGCLVSPSLIERSSQDSEPAPPHGSFFLKAGEEEVACGSNRMLLVIEAFHEAVMKLPYFVENAMSTHSEVRHLLSESFFMVKGAALFLQQGSSQQGQKVHPHHKHAGDLPQHLQVMINILRSEDRIKLAVRLESAWLDRVRYMVVVYTSGRQDTEENILLGIDFTNKDCKSCSIGMVLPLWSDSKIHLDGDGGFTVTTAGRTHVFKPVSVQAMWSALQVLHKACEVSRRYNYFPGGMALTWMGYYESCIASEQSCINEWNTMKDLESTRPDSPTMFVDKPSERERTECLIRAKLRSIMTCQDLENVTSKQIRTELEQHMSCNLKEFKEFIDNEMLLILGQMDKATLIFDHVYLGSEWNASNLEELQETGVGYILNVTREIDNFFPGTFHYHNIRVYDEEATDLLAHWNDTYNFIVKAKKNYSKCLVHCKMGVSRSASTVIAYAMKEYGWSLEKAYNFVKEKRSITRPNPSFMRQLAEYEGILDASKQRHNKLWQPDADCEMTEGQQVSTQCSGEEEGDHLTPEPAMSPCCEDALPDRGAACPSPCRKVALEIDPAYNNYYFRRLSDSALDSEPSTPVRGPPLLGMEKVFIEIEDVERDALLDDEAFDGREGLGLPPFGSTAEGIAAQTSNRGPEPLEELRLRLEFSTVEEEDEEDVQKEEADMEVLMQPDDGGGGDGGGGAEETRDVEVEAEADSNGMDLATLNDNSNNNNRFTSYQNINGTAATLAADVSLFSRRDLNSKRKHISLTSVSDPCLKLQPLDISNTPFLLSSDDLECSTPSLSVCANSASFVSAALPDVLPQPADSLHVVGVQDCGDVLHVNIELDSRPSVGSLEVLPELVAMELHKDTPAVACHPTQQTETFVTLQRSGVVRRHAERLERLSGLTQESLHSLKPLHMSKNFQHKEEEEDFSVFPRDLMKSSTSCQVRLEPLVVPLTNEALLGVVGSGMLTPTSSPHGATLTRSSSSDSLRSVRGKPGLVRQRAQEIETRMRLAGLTVSSRLKRSNSLAKLDSLDISSEDLCSACSSDAGTLLLLSLSPEPDHRMEWESPATPVQSRPCRDLHTAEKVRAGEPIS